MFNNIAPVNSLNSLVRHPIFIIIIVGIAIRLVLAPLFTVGYDSDFWATIIRNLNSGEGLYGLEGYYYTPVWGYILSFISMLEGMFLNIDIMGLRPVETFPLETYSNWFLTSTVTTVSFNFMIKVAYLISDLLVGYIIYWLVKDKTGDVRKATIGFALWFLCPLVFSVASVSGMFDTFSVLFILLCVVMVRKDKLFLAGVLFAFAVLTKFFPAYFIFILLAYVIMKHREDGTAVKAVITSAAGALLGFFVIMLPQILEGKLSESIMFASNRIGGEGVGTLVDAITGYGPILFYSFLILVSLALAYKLTKKDKEEQDDSLFKYLLFMTAVMFLYSPPPQYVVILIPFLAMYIVIWEKKLKWSWLIVSVGGAVFVFSGMYILLLSMGTFTDMFSLEQIMLGIATFETSVFSGLTPHFIVYFTGAAIQYVGILSIVLFFLRKKYIERKKEYGRVIPWPFSFTK